MTTGEVDKDGNVKKAKALTKHELDKIMHKQFAPAIEKWVEDNPDVFPKGVRDVELIMDNSPVHQSAVKNDWHRFVTGWRRECILDHPPYSPDLNEPAEKSHALLKAALHEALRNEPEIRAPRDVKKLITDLWFGRNGRERCMSPETVRGLFHRQMLYYKQVVACNGGYGHKSH